MHPKKNKLYNIWNTCLHLTFFKYIKIITGTLSLKMSSLMILWQLKAIILIKIYFGHYFLSAKENKMEMQNYISASFLSLMGCGAEDRLLSLKMTLEWRRQKDIFTYPEQLQRKRDNSKDMFLSCKHCTSVSRAKYIH